jgi:hypothetical protein
MTAQAYAYHPERAWDPLPCGGRALRHDAQYEPVIEWRPERRSKKATRPPGRPCESIADIDARTRREGGVRLNEAERKRYQQKVRDERKKLRQQAQPTVEAQP